MNYKEKYDKLVEAVKVLQETNLSDEGIQNWVKDNVPELRESEDERIKKEIMGIIMPHTCKTEKEFHRMKELCDWLEKQGTSYTKRDVDDAYVEGMAFAKNELEKQKHTWSEEDERHMNNTIAYLKDTKEFKKMAENCINWLKSLKQRYTWKPSDEQMKALHDMNLTGNISYTGQGQTLIELYNDLKKLKGE